MIIKIKNRNKYDIIYQCLIHCKRFENAKDFPTIKTRFYMVLGGNSKMMRDILSDILIDGKFIELNPNILHYRDVYRITRKGEKYIECYENMMELLLPEEQKEEK